MIGSHSQTMQPRPLALNTSALTHSSGSSVARLGGTAAVAGIRAEILHARNIPEPPAIDLDAPDTDDPSAPLEPDFALPIVVPNIEIAGAAPGLVAGQAPSSRAQALAARVLSLLHLTRVIRASDLRITRKAVNEDGEEEEVLAGYWVLYIDVHVISADGNVFDAIWFAILGALRNARLPRAAWNSDSESVICDADPASLRPLRLRGNPVAASFAVFEPALEKGLRDEKGVWVLNDPDGFEEGYFHLLDYLTAFLFEHRFDI
ncbi:hypothetical protein EJ06DRAFT_518866 [Trichodelitschia bisporula]|uniref:Ribosomal RNA-processing protein 43 n=1 Tax=Trichodelitschia bisporula TaxID=703511 RepID=A0A6G1I828_9PEZI|nr:hypothetical protein EJ06DRAFT_518866 [Trichodelitschia bisporula]